MDVTIGGGGRTFAFIGASGVQRLFHIHNGSNVSFTHTIMASGNVIRSYRSILSTRFETCHQSTGGCMDVSGGSTLTLSSSTLTNCNNVDSALTLYDPIRVYHEERSH